MNRYNFDQVQEWVVHWAPNILIALIILIVAHFVAKSVKWAISKGVSRIPFLARRSAAANDTAAAVNLGEPLGEVAYWIVWLFGLVAALNQLGLVAIVQPLNNMLDGFVRYVPQVVGAALIFFIGFALATIVRRIVEAAAKAAQLDQRLIAAGLTHTPQGHGLARLLGILVFTLIIIPVSIQALDTLKISAISDPATTMLSTVLSAIPRVLGAALVIFIAYVVGRWVAILAEAGLQSVGFDDVIKSLSQSDSIRIGMEKTSPAPAPAISTKSKMPSLPPSRIIGMAILIGVVLFASIEAAKILEFTTMAVMLSEVLSLASRILFGSVIIAVGALIANIVSAAVAKGTNPSDEILRVFSRWGIIALAAAVGLRFMGLANEIVILAFGLILGSIAVAAALAFGVGGREAAKRLLDRWTQ
jgi:hypothetical protein